MAEYINKEFLMREVESRLQLMREENGDYDHYTDGFEECVDRIESQPIADVAEVRHEKWVSASKKQGVNIGMKCSFCGARIKYSEFFNGNHNYCHKCGAKMDGKGDD